MTIEALMTKPCTVTTRTPTGVDAYGDQTYTASATATLCYVDYLATVEHDALDTSTEQEAKIYLPAGTPLGYLDQILVDGQVWEVIGPPDRQWRPTTGEHHVEAHIKLTQG